MTYFEDFEDFDDGFAASLDMVGLLRGWRIFTHPACLSCTSRAGVAATCSAVPSGLRYTG